MSPVVLLFIPFVRLIGHSLASSLGFIGIAVSTVMPVHSLKLISQYSQLSQAHIQVLEAVEIGLLALDVCLLAVVLAFYSGAFVVEEWRALKRLIVTPSPH